MTQGDRLFIVILIIFCFLAVVVKSFQYMENDGTEVYVNELKRGLTYVNRVFQMFQLIFFTGTPSGTPQTPMNTRFFYTVLYVLTLFII